MFRGNIKWTSADFRNSLKKMTLRRFYCLHMQRGDFKLGGRVARSGSQGKGVQKCEEPSAPFEDFEDSGPCHPTAQDRLI
jgi:hypothetical protein